MIPDAPWSPPEVVSVAPSGSRDPAVAVVGSVPHLVWCTDKSLFHSYRQEHSWSSPVRIGYGTQPSLAVGPNGQLHCLFANEFAGNSEVFHIAWDGSKWGLSENVSHTSGASDQPILGIGNDGALHAVWSDTTPGYPVIYHGQRDNAFWTSIPIPSGRGSSPTLAVTRAGQVYVAWQDWLADTGRYDVFCTVLADGNWSPPENVSDSTKAHSILPGLAVSPDGICHIVWQEEKGGYYQILYSGRRPGGWSAPEEVSAAKQDCRVPRIVSHVQGLVQVVWIEGQAVMHRFRPSIFTGKWVAQELVTNQCPNADDMSAALDGAGLLCVTASTADGQSGASIYYAQRQPILQQHAFLPFAARRT